MTTNTETPARHVRTGARVTLLGTSALDPAVVNYRDEAGREFAGYAEDYAADTDDTAERAEAAVVIDQDTPGHTPAQRAAFLRMLDAVDGDVDTLLDDLRAMGCPTTVAESVAAELDAEADAAAGHRAEATYLRGL